MPILSHILKFFKGASTYAAGTQRPDDVQQTAVGGGFHQFASRREQVVADYGRVRVLAQAVSDELLRIAQHGERASVFEIASTFVSCAKKCGLYIDRSEWTKFGDLKRKRSGESEVYADVENKVLTKVKDPAAKQAIKQTVAGDWLYEHIIHNILFPATRYEFLGVSEIAGDFRLVLQQRNIESVDFPAEQTICEGLRSMGLIPERRYFYGNDVIAVTDVSGASDNVLLCEDGTLAFIDPLIQLKRPAIEVIDYLTGVDLTKI